MISARGVARLQFVAARGLLSGMIEGWGVATREDSHVDIVLPDGTLLGARNDSFTIDGWGTIPPGVQVRPPGYERWIRRRVVEFHGDTKVIDAAYQWAYDQRGHQYDKAAILGIIFGRSWHKSGEFICSAFGTDFAHRCRWVKNVFEPAQQTSPNTLYAMAGAAGGTLVTS